MTTRDTRWISRLDPPPATPRDTMDVPLIDLASQDGPIRSRLERAMIDVLDRGDYVLGEAVSDFERAFAAYCGARYGVGVGSGLAALELILRGYGIGAGDEVIVPAHTFVASAGAVALTGARPVLVDVRSDDYTIDPDLLEDAVTPATRAVVGVHLYGRTFDADAVLAVTERYGLKLIEDAAQAHGAAYRGRRAGAIGHAAAFSFYPTKNLGANGDAGMVTTDDLELAERIRAFRNCGQFEKNEHVLLPCNHRLDTLQAAVLDVRLTELDRWNGLRRRAAQRYRNALADLPVTLPPEDAGDRASVYYVFVISTEHRDELAAHLGERGIGTAVHYPRALHQQEVFRDLGFAEGSLPVSEAHARSVLSLPMHPSLTEEQIDYVAEHVRTFYALR